MKIYARQIMPEFQDSRIFDDDGNGVEYINVWGNKDYQSRTSSVFDRVKECLDAGELKMSVMVDEHSVTMISRFHSVAPYVETTWRHSPVFQ